MAKAGTQKAKGDISWLSARTFGQKGNPTLLRLARMNPCVSIPKSEIRNSKLNGCGGDRLREDARWKFGVSPADNAKFACRSIRNSTFELRNWRRLASMGKAVLVLANAACPPNNPAKARFAKPSSEPTSWTACVNAALLNRIKRVAVSGNSELRA